MYNSRLPCLLKFKVKTSEMKKIKEIKKMKTSEDKTTRKWSDLNVFQHFPF